MYNDNSMCRQYYFKIPPKKNNKLLSQKYMVGRRCSWIIIDMI